MVGVLPLRPEYTAETLLAAGAKTEADLQQWLAKEPNSVLYDPNFNPNTYSPPMQNVANGPPESCAPTNHPPTPRPRE
jgi:hypothetical protein